MTHSYHLIEYLVIWHVEPVVTHQTVNACCTVFCFCIIFCKQKATLLQRSSWQLLHLEAVTLRLFICGTWL